MKSHRILLITTLTLLIATSLCELQAQSGHYWTNQYGTRSMLLSGSVIGGVEDLGAVFYNPARLSQTENLQKQKNNQEKYKSLENKKSHPTIKPPREKRKN
jgi:hypothetical protein